MAKAAVFAVWALLIVSLCTLAYASNTPDARDSIVVGGENGMAPLLRGLHFARGIHFGRGLLTKKKKSRKSRKRSRKVKKVKKINKERNCGGSQSIRNVNRGGGGAGGGGGTGRGFIGRGGDGGNGGDSTFEPRNLNLCFSGKSSGGNTRSNVNVNMG